MVVENLYRVGHDCGHVHGDDLLFRDPQSQSRLFLCLHVRDFQDGRGGDDARVVLGVRRRPVLMEVAMVA